MVQGSDGNFYGTTPAGGTGHYGEEGGGTVFKMTPAGAVTILHSFSGQPDGCVPNAGVIQASDGDLYGTTSLCGANNYGMIYKITTSGTLTILHSFDYNDGYLPYGGIIPGSDGNFYGTTASGGADLYGGTGGTVYKMTPSGTLTTLYNFCSQENCTDGHEPIAGVVQGSDGNFYGTTYMGGNGNGNDNQGSNGTVYVVTPSGEETVLYNFCSQANCTDGRSPYAGVIQASDGNFYGVAREGGASDNCTGGCGTAFRLQVSSTLTVTTSGNGAVTSTDGFIDCPGTCSHTYPPNTAVTLNATAASGWSFSGWTGACSGVAECSISMTGSLAVTAVFVEPGDGIQLTTVTPCRLVDTRQSQPILGGTYRSFTLPGLGSCNIPSSALAYSLNVTVVPHGPLGYLTVWPTGEGRAVVSTINSPDGRVKANAATVPAGTKGAVSVYATDTTDVILDIDGYFQAPATGTYEFYSLTPCRVIDTRGANGPLGGPPLAAQAQRNFPVRESNCIPSSVSIAAYSMNFSSLGI
jgi:uncharacterized repeat protein (TIGR03803 family)